MCFAPQGAEALWGSGRVSPASESTSLSTGQTGKVLWIPYGGTRVASSRFQVHAVHRALKARGWESHVLVHPRPTIEDVPWGEEDISLFSMFGGDYTAVLQGVRGPRAERLMEVLQASGNRVIVVEANYGQVGRLERMADVVVTTSAWLAAHLSEGGVEHVEVIDDPAEIWIPPASGRRARRSDHLVLCWIGNNTNWETTEVLRGVMVEPEFSDWTLLTVSDHPGASVEWSRRAVKTALRRADVGCVPAGEGQRYLAKSANRVGMFMAAALPVVAGPIPAYLEVIQDRQNGLIFRNPEELREALRALRDPQLRRQLGGAAFTTARECFDPARTTAAWVALLSEPFRRTGSGPPGKRWSRGQRARALARIEVIAELAVERRALALESRTQAGLGLIRAMGHALRGGSGWRLVGRESARLLLAGLRRLLLLR